MKFFTALKCLADGKKIRHESWEKGDYIYFDGLDIRNRYHEHEQLYIEEFLPIKDDNGWKVLKKKEQPWIKVGDFIVHPHYTCKFQVMYADECKVFVIDSEKSPKKGQRSAILFRSDFGTLWKKVS